MAFLDYNGLARFKNKIVQLLNSMLSQKQDTLSFDQVPTENSYNPVTSNGINSVISELRSELNDTYVKSVNGNTPDIDGDVDIDSVALANNLISDNMLMNSGQFSIRTTGGQASISDGDAWALKILGNSVHTGYIAPVIDVTIIAAERSEGADAITVDVDEDAFCQYVVTSGTTTLTYTNVWSDDPSLYGITVNGTPISGDQIVIAYTAEERGTITNASPYALKSTGFNLYNHANNGVIPVCKYSDIYGFKISGTYTGVQFLSYDSVTTDITPDSNGLFSIPEDGFLIVSGGNSTDTVVIATWSDWVDGYEGYFEAYSETTVDFTSVVNSYFPNGMAKVGDVCDEIDFDHNTAYVRIERVAYTSENIASAKSSGMDYDADENWIYIVKENADQYSIGISNSYTANDHGMEYFLGISVPAGFETIYGNNLKNKLERDVLTISQQTLTDNQKEQVLSNIGLGGILDRLPQNGNKYLSSFSEIPAMQGFYTIQYSGSDADAPITTSGVWWWNVIQIGVIGSTARITQIAFSPFRNREKIYIRQKHDASWYGWYTLAGSGNYTSSSMSARTGTGGTVSQNAVYINGSTVSFCGRISGMTANNTANGSFFTIPNGYRPPTTTYVNGYAIINGTVRPAIYGVTSAGAVNLIFSSSSTTTEVYVAGSYGI